MVSNNLDGRPTDSSTGHDQARWTRRATRLAVGAPIAYRSASTGTWFRAAMVDISRSGVLFVPVGQEVPDPDLRLVIFLSRAALQAGGVNGLWPDLYCGGPVIRTEQLADGRWAIAVRFEYQWASEAPDTGDDDRVH